MLDTNLASGWGSGGQGRSLLQGRPVLVSDLAGLLPQLLGVLVQALVLLPGLVLQLPHGGVLLHLQRMRVACSTEAARHGPGWTLHTACQGWSLEHRPFRCWRLPVVMQAWSWLSQTAAQHASLSSGRGAWAADKPFIGQVHHGSCMGLPRLSGTASCSSPQLGAQPIMCP